MISNTHSNNFNILRLIFAILVVFSHAYGLLAQAEPHLWGRSLGNWSVHGFFIISGYLICQSYFRSPSLISYTFNRCLRIMPALVVAIFLGKAIAILCDGFKGNYVPYIVNGPVWTLTWEVACYIGLAILGLGRILNTNTIPSFFGAIWLIYLYNISNVNAPYLVIAPLVIMFISGAFIAIMEDKINYNRIPWLAVFGLVITFDYELFLSLYNTIVSNVPFLYGPEVTAEQVIRIIYLMSFPIVLIYLGKNFRFVLAIKNDISYGVYIYAWPIAQMIVYFSIKNDISLSAIPFFILTLIFTIPLAYISWIYIEKPSLKLKKIFVMQHGLKHE
ncbi:acyltransferase [Vibrio fluvialis]|nr:acyltransferase [Vibrio fluvialis]